MIAVDAACACVIRPYAFVNRAKPTVADVEGVFRMQSHVANVRADLGLSTNACVVAVLLSLLAIDYDVVWQFYALSNSVSSYGDGVFLSQCLTRYDTALGHSASQYLLRADGVQSFLLLHLVQLLG